MRKEFNPLIEPGTGAIQPPMVYVKKDLTWEYRRIRRDIEREDVLDEEELNSLGAEGWELTTSVKVDSVVYFYFRRPG